MAFSSINSAIAAHCWKTLRLIATDMDGTLTRQGKFSRDLLQGLETLQAADIPVLIVTGRSAGWVSGLVNYLPVQGAIAENGGLYYPANQEQPIFLSTIADITPHRQQLADTYQRLKSEFPQLHESADNRFRITDWTFDNRNLSVAQLEHLNALCISMDWEFTYSSVQCHIKPRSQDKATGLIQVLRDYFPQYQPEQVLTVGDSPNDASLFNPQLFPLSVGVANVLEYSDELDYQPAYVTVATEGDGFCELVEYLNQLM
ncbi:HAD-IIB family hydrolase [Coleofasciculus chthonoplastes]|jgi:HAD superfamily hydrolase (TIGR01484 family)|uniref:HAD-IIB family hydrolase n=1 Tax=Coleofasciculus chthonoplastes TaxID=64178 RepID=UPI0032F8EFD3